MDNLNEQSQRHYKQKRKFLILASSLVLMFSIVSSITITRSHCTDNWIDRWLHLSRGCSAVSDLSYQGTLLKFTDQQGNPQSIDLIALVEQATAGATTYRLEGANLIATTLNETGSPSTTTVDLSPLSGRDQTLSLSGTTLSLSDGNSVDLSDLVRGAQGARGLQGPAGLQGIQGTPGVLTVSNGMLTLNSNDLSIVACGAGQTMNYSGATWQCGSYTNSLSSSANTMTSTVNGVVSTADIIRGNALALDSAGNLTGMVNGVASNTITLPVNSVQNGLSLVGNIAEQGGLLLHNTTISQSGYNYSFTGGNVGIGTNTPNNTLEITSAAAGTSGLRLTNLTSAASSSTSSNKVLTVNANGDLVLAIVPGTQNIVDFSVNTNPNTAGTTFSPNVPQDNDVIYASTIDNSMWQWNGSAYVTYVPINTNWSLRGNAGTTPGVNFLGTTDAKALVFKTNNIQSGYIATTGGNNNVSFGLSALNPTTTGVSNSSFGSASLAYNTTGSYNTASGYNALYANTIGNNNTANGHRTLYFNTTGSNNTANGYSALSGNTIGNNNTASGYTALYSNTTANNNTANGYGAMGHTTTAAGSFLVGTQYTIRSVGTTDFTLIGAASNTPGVSFTATGAGTGTGTASADITGGNNTALGVNALYSNTTGNSNTANGYSALYSNTTGNYNTASGTNALRLNTTGNQNTANGHAALYYNTTGSFNTASGYSALYSNTTGNQNTANGFQALYSNTTGNSNTASGYVSLFSNTTGTANVASGYSALFSNTTGNANVAQGLAALYSNTTGNNNTANGYSGLYANTIGSGNTANGYVALYSNTTANNNTANGYGAMGHTTTAAGSFLVGTQYTIRSVGTTDFTLIGAASNTPGVSFTATGAGTGTGTASADITGGNNTALGYNALWANTIGTDNTALGYRAGGSLISGSRNIVIGSDQNLASNTESNQLNIGGLIFGTGLTGNQSAPAGAIGIGNTAPGYLLHVGSSTYASGTSVARFENAGGTCTVTPNVAGGITCTSDMTLKKDITDVSYASSVLDMLDGVDVKSYHMLADDAAAQKQTGFIAQNLQTIFPSVVATDNEGKLSVSYSAMAPILTLGVQQLHAKTTDLEARVNTLETKSLTQAAWNGGVVSLDSSFNGNVSFNGPVAFTSDAAFAGHITVGQDTAGRVTVPAGRTIAHVVFSKAYAAEPSITAAKTSFITGDWRINPTKDASGATTGFDLELQSAQSTAVTFTWTALGTQ